MGRVPRPILFDADAIINLHEWGCFRKLCGAIGSSFVISDVVLGEALYYKEMGTSRKVRIDLGHLNSQTVPRRVSDADLSVEDHSRYLGYFAALVEAGAGERQTFALAWVLEYDVCSLDSQARGIFHRHRPKGCPSRHLWIMELMRELGLVK